MPNCTTKQIHFSSFNRKKVQVNFNGGNITSDAGVLLLREVDKKMGLTKALSQVIPDDRHPSYVDHKLQPLLKQRIYSLALGYEDLNDHDQLRHDAALQTAVESEQLLSSASTLSRLENKATRETAIKMHQVLVEQFVAKHKKPPKELILDFDATDDLIHGNQEGSFFHGYYRHHCFLPLYVFCGHDLLVSYLRRSNQDGAKHAWAILSVLVKRFRKEWPDVKIIFRADGGFCRHRLFDWCEKHEVFYITGATSNARLMEITQEICAESKKVCEETQEKQRFFADFYYAAKTWSKKRRMIVKAEHQLQGPNTRFIVTNLLGDPKELYDKIYCARGDMENRIKEQQLDLFADRTSCHDWWANQFRLLLSSCAYVLCQALKRIALKGTEFAKHQMGTLRNKCFKIGAVVIRNTRRVQVFCSSAYPYQSLFALIAQKLCPQ